MIKLNYEEIRLLITVMSQIDNEMAKIIVTKLTKSMETPTK